MAWARDIATGEPLYILELDATRRGAQCGCECPGCGLALTAVNAAKAEFEIRPHFRHHAGVQQDECLVLASRAALLRQFEEGGWLELPRRRISASVTGLSGEIYGARVEQPAEKLHISQVNYRDRTEAVVTFDDGRQLRVQLTGMSGPQMQGVASPAMPTIVLDVEDPSLASMDPKELRSRLSLLPNTICWRHHWRDQELLAQAKREATRRAQFELDALPDDLELPPDVPLELRRESVLHYEVKRILAEERRIRVPGLSAEASAVGEEGQTVSLHWSEPAQILSLDYVELEQRFGRLIPDVTCKAWPADGGRVVWPLLVEVTVTNPVDDERLAKIREHGETVLEIDFSRAGGWVNREQLKHLVVEELSLKRWLFNAELEEHKEELLANAKSKAEEDAAVLEAQRHAIAERRRQVLAAPLETLAGEYLDAATTLNDALAASDSDGRQTVAQKATELAAKERAADAADKLALRGYPEACNEDFIGYHGIVARILSCKLDRPVGYRVANVMSVLNAIWQVQGHRRSFHSLFFIALNVYSPKLKPEQAARVEGWRTEVRQSIRGGETTFLRDPGYDRLLSLLFPEMAEALAKLGGKRQMIERTPFAQANRHAYFIEHQPRVDRAKARLLDTLPGQWWLKGRDLDAWKQANPIWVGAQFDHRDATS